MAITYEDWMISSVTSIQVMAIILVPVGEIHWKTGVNLFTLW